MSDLLDRLQSAVGHTYRIEEELGGGGMSRVFRAVETDLGRRVVIKVLPPDMSAGVNKERFQREIRLAASLQHPHIVPLLTTGAVDGDILYYVMPLIDGESLRAKLTREGELPVAETVRLLREVVDALDYAHRHDVVHRDIKPDNILLSEGHAVVTDFGVAKAVSASAGEASSLTSLGVALGTPAYMSPEQAAADPNVDHRADIYAVGALAYEMLAGRPPFVGMTPQQILAAQVSQQPDPLEAHRETVPTPVSAVVMRCLAKRAADRWQTSAELRAQLDTVATPASGGLTPTATQPVSAASTQIRRQHHPVRIAALFGAAAAATLVVVYALMIILGLPDWVFVAAIALLAVGAPIILATRKHEEQRALTMTTGMAVTTPVGLQRHFTWRKSILGGAGAFMALGMATASYSYMRSAGIGPAGTLLSTGVIGERELIIVAEFENRTSDTTLSATVAELMRISLSESPVIRIADQARLAQSLARMALPADAPIGEAVAREIAERENLKAIVAGDVSPLGAGFVLSGRLVSAEGQVLAAQQASAAEASGLISAVDQLSAKLRERIGESLRTIRRTRPLELVTTGSLDALRLYSQATVAEIAGDDDRAVALLEEAIGADSTFAMAYRKLGTILGNNFEQRARALDAVSRAYEYRERLTDLERGYAVAQYHSAVTGRQDEVLAAYRTILEQYPDDHRALNNTGVVYANMGDNVRAREYYQRALDLDSTWSPGFMNLAVTQMWLGEFDEADRTIGALERSFPGNPRVLDARGQMALAQRDFATAQARWDSLLVQQRGNLGWEASLSERLGYLSGMQGRVVESQRWVEQALDRADQRGVASERMRMAAWWASTLLDITLEPDSVRQWFEAAATDELMESLAVPDRDYESLVFLYALLGDANRAASYLEAMESSGWSSFGLQAERALDRSAGIVELVRGNLEPGLRLIRSGIEGWNCVPCRDATMARAFSIAGMADSAVVYWDRYLGTTYGFAALDSGALPTAYRRLGEAHEALGNRDEAARYYSELLDLWEDADPAMEPQIRDLRARVARLVGETP